MFRPHIVQSSSFQIQYSLTTLKSLNVSVIPECPCYTWKSLYIVLITFDYSSLIIVYYFDSTLITVRSLTTVLKSNTALQLLTGTTLHTLLSVLCFKDTCFRVSLFQYIKRVLIKNSNKIPFCDPVRKHKHVSFRERVIKFILFSKPKVSCLKSMFIS